MTTYGLTLKDLRRFAVVSSILGLLVLVVELITGLANRTFTQHLGLSILVPAAIAFGAPAFVGICSLSHLVVEGDQIQLRVGPWLMRTQHLDNLITISLRNRAMPVVLTFRDGTRMHLLAIPLWRREALCDDLTTHAQHPISILR